MSDRQLDVSRREVLAAATGAGVLGAVAAGGTDAVVSDKTIFPDSTQSSGDLDLLLCWTDSDSERCEPTEGSSLAIDLGSVAEGDSGSGTIRLRLPDDGSNNPGWLWLRSTCPRRACGIYGAMRVTLYHGPPADGQPLVVGGQPIDGLRLCTALQRLAQGTQLDPVSGSGPVEPLQPGEEFRVGLEWTVTDPVCAIEDEDVATLEFAAQQRRHNADPDPPWAPRECEVNCDQDCRDDCNPGYYIAFCADGGGGITKYDVGMLRWTPNEVEWRTTRPIDAVIIRDGGTYQRYAPKGGLEAGTTYSLERGDHVVPHEQVDQLGLSPKYPCSGPEESGVGCGIRYNFAGGTWHDACGEAEKNDKGGDGGD